MTPISGADTGSHQLVLRAHALTAGCSQLMARHVRLNTLFPVPRRDEGLEGTL